MIIMSTFESRKLKARIIGADAEKATSDSVITDLKAASVPISSADCRICPDPCDEGHDDWPPRFDVDMETFMLGSVKPYQRQLVISTGKSDWEREVTDAAGTLAAFLSETQPKDLPSDTMPGTLTAEENGSQKKPSIRGIFEASGATRVSLLNGSHVTVSDDHSLQTILAFPDYKMVSEVPESVDGAKEFWRDAFNLSVDPQEAKFKSWVLPYSCVILLCSHKKRDNRCSIAAIKLEEAFIHSLNNNDWETHTRLECPETKPLESLTGTSEEKAATIVTQLKALPDERKALILKNSHTGGHKFAGNCIIYTPQGSGVWYGRVTTHEVESIVKNTIIGGEVLPPLLRGGVNIARPGCKNLHDW